MVKQQDKVVPWASPFPSPWPLLILLDTVSLLTICEVDVCWCFQPTYTGILDAILDSQSQTHGQEDGREKEKESKEKDADSTR